MASRFLLAVALVVLIGASTAAATNKCNGTSEAGQILAVLKGRGCYKTFLSILDTTGLTKALPDIITKHKLTMLIPNDAAFAKIPSSTLSAVLKKPAYLKQIVYLHLLRGLWNAAGLCKKPKGYAFTTLACYMSALTNHYNAKGASPVQYCAFGGSVANEDVLAKDMYCSPCASVQGLSDVIIPGANFAKTCNYAGK